MPARPSKKKESIRNHCSNCRRPRRSRTADPRVDECAHPQTRNKPYSHQLQSGAAKHRNESIEAGAVAPQSKRPNDIPAAEGLEQIGRILMALGLLDHGRDD